MLVQLELLRHAGAVFSALFLLSSLSLCFKVKVGDVLIKINGKTHGCKLQ